MLFKKDSALRFLDSIKLKGQLETNEAIFNISKTCFSVLTNTKVPVLAIAGNLKIEGEEIGEIGVSNIGLLRNVFASIPSDTITVIKKKNKLIVSDLAGKIEVSLILVNTEYIKTKISEDKFQTNVKETSGNEFILTPALTSQLVEYLTTLKAETLILEGKDDILTVNVEANENSLVGEIKLDTKLKEPFEIKFNADFLLSVLRNTAVNNLTMSLKSNKIAYFINTDKDSTYTIEYLLAPIQIKDKE